LSDTLELTLRNDISEVARVIDAIEAFGERNDVPARKIFQLNLALDELITNIVSYGFDGQSDSQIKLSVELKDRIISAELVDNGKAFNPVEAVLPELGEGIEDRQIGGLGIKFVRTYMDHLDYRREGGCNRLRLQMNVQAANDGQLGNE
jgi:anti-sigma regulatory factor (Ser/Thr protein kinase)